MLLYVDNVSKSYADGKTKVSAVTNVSLQLSTGDFTAVCGPSGCGKSTLLLMAGALLNPDSGQVIIDGQDPYGLKPDARAEFRARNVGFVFQQFHLVPYLSVLDNILAPAIAITATGRETHERAVHLVERFGLSDRRDHVPAKLSTGERQRVAMARALMNQPKLLLADEPTGNLDQRNAEVMLGYLSEFAARDGAVLLVTHDYRAVTYAKRVISLERGRIVESKVS